MYTVFRIMGPESKVGGLQRAVDAINAGGSGGLVELRQRDDGYVVDLCDQPSWVEHSAAIFRFVVRSREALALARADGASLVVDVAVEPEDGGDTPWLAIILAEDLLDALASVSARFEVSLYA